MSSDEPIDNGGTTSAAYRWRYLSTTVTALVVAVYLGLVLAKSLGYAMPLDGGTWATFNLAFIGVLVYSLGIDTLKAAADIYSGLGQ